MIKPNRPGSLAVSQDELYSLLRGMNYFCVHGGEIVNGNDRAMRDRLQEIYQIITNQPLIENYSKRCARRRNEQEATLRKRREEGATVEQIAKEYRWTVGYARLRLRQANG